VLEPDEGKPSSPVLRGLGASNGARLLDKVPASTHVSRFRVNQDLMLELRSLVCIFCLINSDFPNTIENRSRNVRGSEQPCHLSAQGCNARSGQ